MLGNFSFFCCRLLTFFKINFFEKFFQEHYQSVKQFGSRSGPTLCRSWSGSKLFAKVINKKWVATCKEELTRVGNFRTVFVIFPYLSLFPCMYMYNIRTVKPVLRGHSKEDQQSVFKTDYRLIWVKSIAEWIQETAILSTCIKLPSVFKTFVFPIFKWLLKTGLKVIYILIILI